ncbi:hypothetical protein [Nocardia sp. NPDC050793]|uniref:hypothetical protein n=1 Tax=Nocardia sp. NPDC050793 TaxID=3155159 RepID=UPI0033D6055A
MGARATLMTQFIQRLTDRLAGEGFAPVPPLDGEGEAEPGTRSPAWRRVWFAASDSGIRCMTSGVMAHVDCGNRGELRIGGRAFIVAQVVEEVLEACRDLNSSVGAFSGGEIDSIPFGYFDNPLDASRKISLSHEVDLDYAVNQFMRFVRGPVYRWFEQRSSVDKLSVLARASHPMDFDKVNPEPMRLRGCVILSVLADRVEDAASLMGWYLDQSQFHAWDSFEQAAAFDVALGQQFPGYARARGR